MPAAGPSPEQVERFRAKLRSLAGGEPRRIGAAVSGGPDSLALLLLSAAAFPEAVEAATIDHGLRPESAGEAAFVADICVPLGVGHATLHLPEPISGNVQSSARRARYELLESWRRRRGLDWILTGHHADDQAETLVMRLNRGSGVAGLSAVRARNGAILRPLLAWRRSELEAIVASAGIAPVADPSNVDERYDRARIRRELAGAPWVDAESMARSAEALAEADAALDWAVGRLEAERVSDRIGILRLDPQDLPQELRRRLLLRILRRLNPKAEPRGEEITRLADALDRGETATLAAVKATGGALWRFEAAPPRRSG